MQHVHSLDVWHSRYWEASCEGFSSTVGIHGGAQIWLVWLEVGTVIPHVPFATHQAHQVSNPGGALVPSELECGGKVCWMLPVMMMG